MVIRQPYFDLVDECPFTRSDQVEAAIELLANSGGMEERGAIFTRQTVVGFILDLAGYTDGTVKRDIKFKRVEADLCAGRCALLDDAVPQSGGQ